MNLSGNVEFETLDSGAKNDVRVSTLEIGGFSEKKNGEMGNPEKQDSPLIGVTSKILYAKAIKKNTRFAK